MTFNTYFVSSIKNSQVESITSILGTNTMGTEPIIENTSSGTNYFAKVGIKITSLI